MNERASEQIGAANERASGDGNAPLLRVVRGTPDDAELAALTAVVAGLAARPRPAPAASESRWADRAALTRRALPTGPGAWRAAALPR